MMKIAPVILLLALAACTYNPSYTGIHCGPEGACPDGYRCIQERCFPNTEEPAEEIGPDGDAGTNAPNNGTADGEDAVEAGDAPEDGADADAPADAGDGDCFPPCGENNVCDLVSCDGRDYVCRAFFNPLRYDWNPVEQDLPHWCRLSAAVGPLLDDLRCKDGNNLQFYCPWDGICADEQCVHNPEVERTHHCGATFGCEGDQQAGHCRMHRKEGEGCQFNYDCESFCCSQDNNAVCIAYNASQCKIHTTLYWEGITTLYTWRAKGTSDFHDISEWTFLHGDEGTKCTGNSNCDSGYCRHFTVIGEKRCEFGDCVNAPEAADIKATYFCPAGDDHTGHMTQVTNQNPGPPPDACPE